MKPRMFFWMLVIAAVFFISRLASASNLPPEPPTATGPIPDPIVIPQEQYRGRTAAQWYKAWLLERRRLQKLVAHHPSVTEAISLAAAVYGNGSTLWRRARCESHLWPYAHNPSGASGLFQFLPSTWRSTPFGRFSVWSPYANALAAGWMMGPAGRGGEWSCR